MITSVISVESIILTIMSVSIFRLSCLDCSLLQAWSLSHYPSRQPGGCSKVRPGSFWSSFKARILPKSRNNRTTRNSRSSRRMLRMPILLLLEEGKNMFLHQTWVPSLWLNVSRLQSYIHKVISPTNSSCFFNCFEYRISWEHPKGTVPGCNLFCCRFQDHFTIATQNHT